MASPKRKKATKKPSFSWNPQNYSDVEQAVSIMNLKGDLTKRAYLRIITSNGGFLPCPAPESDPNGQYGVVYQDDVFVIQQIL